MNRAVVVVLFMTNLVLGILFVFLSLGDVAFRASHVGYTVYSIYTITVADVYPSIIIFMYPVFNLLLLAVIFFGQRE